MSPLAPSLPVDIPFEYPNFSHFSTLIFLFILQIICIQSSLRAITPISKKKKKKKKNTREIPFLGFRHCISCTPFLNKPFNFLLHSKGIGQFHPSFCHTEVDLLSYQITTLFILPICFSFENVICRSSCNIEVQFIMVVIVITFSLFSSSFPTRISHIF